MPNRKARQESKRALRQFVGTVDNIITKPIEQPKARITWHDTLKTSCGCRGNCKHVMAGKGRQSLIGRMLVRDADGIGLKTVYRISTMTSKRNTLTVHYKPNAAQSYKLD